MKIYITVVLLFLVVVLLFLVLMCRCGENKHTPFQYTNIQAVYYHERCWYSFAWSDTNANNAEIQILSFNGYNTIVKIYADVPPTNSMWIAGDMIEKGGGRVRYDYNIHIHNVNDINTAGWNHGKFGTGTTTRIN